MSVEKQYFASGAKYALGVGDTLNISIGGTEVAHIEITEANDPKAPVYGVVYCRHTGEVLELLTQPDWHAENGR